MFNNINNAIKWLGGTVGLFTICISFIYYYFNNSLTLEYIKPLEKGYKFQFINNTLFNQKINSFRVILDQENEQDFIFVVDRNIKGTITKDGVIIPGGNVTYIPATEYKGVDNISIKSRDKKIFRIPPISSRYYLKPYYAILRIKYSYSSTNKIINLIDSIFKKIGFLNKEKLIRYLIMKDEWIEIPLNRKETVTEIMCREEDMLFKDLCKKYNK